MPANRNRSARAEIVAPWASERSNFSCELVEMALAHVNADKVEEAYFRGDLLAKRRKLMEAWALYCTTPKVSKIVAFRQKV